MATGSNQMLEPGNVSVAAPYFISGLTGLLPAATSGAIYCLQNLGRAPLFSNPGTALANVPINVSQVRVKFAATTAGTAGFTVSKVSIATQFNAGGASVASTQRKTTGYPPIPTAEVNAFVAGTVVITGGITTLQGVLDMTDGTQGLIWKPSDLCPLILEQGEGILVATSAAMGGAGNVLVAVDFLRQ